MKLNYHSQKREIKRLKAKKQKGSGSKRKASGSKDSEPETSSATTETDATEQAIDEAPLETATSTSFSTEGRTLEQECWKKPGNVEEKNRDEEFEEYLENLLL